MGTEVYTCLESHSLVIMGIQISGTSNTRLGTQRHLPTAVPLIPVFSMCLALVPSKYLLCAHISIIMPNSNDLLLITWNEYS